MIAAERDTKYTDILVRTQSSNCLLCDHAPCTSVCPKHVNISRLMRAMRFENEKGAAQMLGDVNPCENCQDTPCIQACNRGKIDEPVHIKKVIEVIHQMNSGENHRSIGRADLKTSLCGVPCENPFFLSSSVVGSSYEMVAKAFSMGWAGVAFKTIGMFVPEEVSPRFDCLQKESNPFIGMKNIEQISEHSLKENLETFQKLKQNYPDKVIIASIMGQNEDEWTTLARLVEEAGADVVECNFSCPHMSGQGLGSDVGTNPELVATYTRAVRRGTRLPILAKMTPNITSMEIPATAAMQAGADGIAAINTIKSIMNIDLSHFVSGPAVRGKSAVGGYSGKAVKPIALRFIQDMKQCEELRDVEISGMGGIETWRDAAEFISLGCATVQITTAVMQYGYRIVDELLDGLSIYLADSGIGTVENLCGKALQSIVPADKLDRRSISYPKFNRENCVGCGRCYVSCYDGGHQAILRREDGKPVLLPKKCAGCQLCVKVCPAGAIEPGQRVEKRK